MRAITKHPPKTNAKIISNIQITCGSRWRNDGGEKISTQIATSVAMTANHTTTRIILDLGLLFIITTP